MSEKRYVIVSPSHHKKPRAMFLNVDGNGKYFWRKSIAGTTYTWLLSDAQKVVKDTPIGCYIVEHSQDLLDWFDYGETCKFSRFMHIVADCGNEIINSWRQTEIVNETPEAKPEVREEKRYYLYNKSADGKVKYFCSKDADKVALHKNQRVQIFTQPEAHELQYLPYTDESDAEIWHVGDIGLWSENLGEAESEPQPSPAPEAKKLKYFGYVVFYSDVDDHKEYCNNSKMRIWGNSADVFRTQEDAQFAADVLNSNSDTNLGWQVEQIEF